jgi:DNA-binding FadR family transcriptional regulator
MIEAGSLIRSLSGRAAARNFHTYVINEIGSAIVAGRFPVGSVLASDAVMMETYGVSRTVLREALKTLEAKGLVEARPKVGTRVSPKSRWNYFDPQVLAWHFEAPPDAKFHASLFEVRASLEALGVRHAARHRTAEQVRLLKYWAHQTATADDNIEQFGLACLEVHAIIAECSQNALLRSVVGVVELTLALALTRNDADAVTYRDARSATLDALVDAIEAGAGDAAAAALGKACALDESRVAGRLGEVQ